MGSCNCCSEKEQHDITVESTHRPTEKAADDHSEIASAAKEQEVVFESEDSVASLQAALRCYLTRKLVRTQSQSAISATQATAPQAEDQPPLNELFGPPMQTEDVSADYIGNPEDLLTPIVRKVLHELPHFDYSSAIQGVRQRNALRLKDGSVYVGEWFERTRFGKGKFYCIDGSFHEGYWKNGRLHYRGRVIYSNGDYYEGQMVDGIRQGEGKLVSIETRSSYVGHWKDDRQHGVGTETFAENNSTYVGEFANGTKDGMGEFKWGDGSSYKGGFRTNLLEGRGHYVWADQRQYDGQWVNNQMHGKGRFLWPDGRVYEGDYKNDKKEGYGVYNWENGKLYEGYWKDGKMHGEGYLTVPGKPRRKYTFVNGKKGDAIEDLQ